MSRHPDWKHTLRFGDLTCLCSTVGDGVCAIHRGEVMPKPVPGFENVDRTYQDWIATRNIGDDYQARHALSSISKEYRGEETTKGN